MARIESLKLPHADIRYRKEQSPEEGLRFLNDAIKVMVEQINRNYGVQERIINLSDTQSATKLRSWMGL